MTSQEIGRDPIEYAAMNFWPIMYYKIGRDLAIFGRDIIQTNRITNNWLRHDYDYITSNHIRSRPNNYNGIITTGRDVITISICF